MDVNMNITKIVTVNERQIFLFLSNGQNKEKCTKDEQYDYLLKCVFQCVASNESNSEKELHFIGIKR